ncbi:MAG: TlpA family protein disulfide reductase [Candidatus Zixiibacteriota bacterium]
MKGLIAVLFVINLLLLAEVYRLKSGPAPLLVDISSYIEQPELPEVPVADSSGKLVNLCEVVARDMPTLMVFFSSSDCPNCFSEKSLWSEVSDETATRVVGVAVSSSGPEFWQWVSYMDFPIPIYLDTTYAIFDSMQFRVTPLKVLVKENGDLMWADPPRLSKPEQMLFWREFNYAIEEYF